MADIISRLKLESGEFDSKIKRASQELKAYSQHCRKMGLEMGYANKDAKEFAKSLGSMQTTATTARGKVSELSDAFVNLKAMYNQMTDAEKQGQFGKNLAVSLDQLKQRTQQAKQELADITKELNGASNIGGGGGLFSSDKLSGMLQVFGGNLMTKGLKLATGAVSKLTSEIGGMITQGIEMAKQGEGIRIAFERLGRGDILDGLRQATHGTVTDLELMKAAVKFNDFKLPVEELGTMLAFAQQKAKDTGQSVDYMVDSIVTGLGRKSLMILDNLGLSANEIKEKMKQTGDMTKAVGQIIREQMAKAGDYVETAADRAAQANVSLQNKMEELGRKFAPIEEASNQLWTSMKIGILDIIDGPLTQLLNGLTEAGRMRNALNNMGGNEQVNNQLGKLRVAKAAGSGYMIRSLYSRQVEQYNRQINAADTYLKQYDSNHSAVNTVLMAASKQFGQKFDSISDLKAFKDAYVSMKNEYVKGSQEIMNATSGAKGTTTTTTTTKKATKTGKTSDQIIREQFAAQQRDSLAYSSSYKSTAADQPSDAWRAFTESQTQVSKSIEDALQALNKKEGISPKGRPKDTQNVSDTEQFEKTMGDIRQVTGGVTSIVSGIQQLGVEIPEEMSKVLGAINVISGILTTIASLATIMTATSTVKAVPVFGWLLAGGGIVHAAGGYSVPGNHYSGDNVPALLNSGELVLNRAQQFNLASQLQGNGMQGLNLTATIRGEQIRLALNNNGRRTGRGEYVQSNKR